MRRLGCATLAPSALGRPPPRPLRVRTDSKGNAGQPRRMNILGRGLRRVYWGTFNKYRSAEQPEAEQIPFIPLSALPPTSQHPVKGFAAKEAEQQFGSITIYLDCTKFERPNIAAFTGP